MENLGEKIKYLRVSQNLTQPQLAKKIGVSNGIISIWENNINEPKANYIKKMCYCFGVSADYLLGLEDETGAKIQNNVYDNHGNITFNQR